MTKSVLILWLGLSATAGVTGFYATAVVITHSPGWERAR